MSNKWSFDPPNTCADCSFPHGATRSSAATVDWAARKQAWSSAVQRALASAWGVLNTAASAVTSASDSLQLSPAALGALAVLGSFSDQVLRTDVQLFAPNFELR